MWGRSLSRQPSNLSAPSPPSRQFAMGESGGATYPETFGDRNRWIYRMPALSFCQKDLSMSRGECLSQKLPPKMTRFITAAHYCGILRLLSLSTSVQTARAARTTSRIISRCMTLSHYFQRDPSAMRHVQTTFSCAHGPLLFSQGNRPCRLCGRSAGPSGCGRRDQTFPHSLRSGSPTWS
jgi:hypothetical protein